MKSKYFFLCLLLLLMFSCLSGSEESEDAAGETEQEETAPPKEQSSAIYNTSNEVTEFIKTPSGPGYLYFSYLNPKFKSDKEEQCLFNVLSEIVSFVDLKMGYGSYDQSYGSFILSDMKIKVYTDAAVIDELVDLVELVGKIKDTKNGDIITVKVETDKLNQVWSRYNTHPLPQYNLSIEQTINESGIPSWFLTLPEMDGYIFGAGVYSNVSDTSALIHYADVAAKAEIIKTVGTKVSGELKDYFEDTFQFYSFLNKQVTAARLPGMYIINRYYDSKSGNAYSLAVLKTK